MDIIEVAQELMRFKTETGNKETINQAMNFIKNTMSLIGAKVDIFEAKDTAPVIFIRNKKTLDFDALVLGHIDVVPAEDKINDLIFRTLCLMNGHGIGQRNIA